MRPSKYTIPTANTDLLGITKGPDGAIWFTETNTKKIGRLITGVSLTASHDFNNNGDSDIAWRDTTDNTALWLMNGMQDWALSHFDCGDHPK